MRITFLGATKTVTGSKYLITAHSKKILIDCGLYQGYKELRQRNWDKFPIDPKKIDAVILTHAHIDHSGYIPVLIKNGFKGKIYCTHGTRDLCALLLPDSGHIQEEDANRANRYHYSKHHPAMPLYTKEDGINALQQFYPVNYDELHELFNNVITFKFLAAGHIIGSSFIQLQANGRTILFTGDLGRPHHPIMQPPAIVKSADYLVTESTYGDRLHDRSDPENKLAEVIEATIARKGSVIIPAFAVGRSQDVLYYVHMLKKANRIPDVPVYLDSPMAQDVSDLLIHYSREHQLNKEVCKAICKTATYVKTPEESKLIDIQRKPSIIISASGMMEGGRILHHLKAYLPDEKNTILITGFQAPGTRGDRLLRGESAIKIHGEMIPVRANIVSMDNMSAHADADEILDWMRHFKRPPHRVFITHGNQESAASLQNKIEKEFKWQCEIPDYLQEFELK